MRVSDRSRRVRYGRSASRDRSESVTQLARRSTPVTRPARSRVTTPPASVIQSWSNDIRRRLFSPWLSWLFTTFKNKERLGSSPLVFGNFRVEEVSRRPGILGYSGAATLFLAQLLP